MEEGSLIFRAQVLYVDINCGVESQYTNCYDAPSVTWLAAAILSSELGSWATWWNIELMIIQVPGPARLGHQCGSACSFHLGCHYWLVICLKIAA